MINRYDIVLDDPLVDCSALVEWLEGRLGLSLKAGTASADRVELEVLGVAAEVVRASSLSVETRSAFPLSTHCMHLHVPEFFDDREMVEAVACLAATFSERGNVAVIYREQLVLCDSRRQAGKSLQFSRPVTAA